MKALRHFIVQVPEKTTDKVTVGGKELFLDTRFNEFDHRICYGEVLSAPLIYDTGVKKGDTLFFHHHVTISKSLELGENKYIVFYDENQTNQSHAIAYRDSDGELHMLAGWVFVQPIEVESVEEVTESGIIVDLDVSDVEYEKEAKMFMPHPDHIAQGVKAGDTVGFDKDRDYKMKLDDGTIVYRMLSDNISYVVN